MAQRCIQTSKSMRKAEQLAPLRNTACPIGLGKQRLMLGHRNPKIVGIIHNHDKHLNHLFSRMLSPAVIFRAGLLDIAPSTRPR
ncbi:uncharacterized protein RCC_05083 [Ramularia collo-cygni]|uniref:Uncharacterized protein n=1 Tax=Ramularia collo-cygni TaxID=112498 RepID=A0A2D3V3H2_9PEZI|nr:uncharacterized protein RCC_05083 [Ramularia collo-cygni]CZT19237.1 uncharacterized protein RCC_05083 [Ramularia collo-cygni]